MVQHERALKNFDDKDYLQRDNLMNIVTTENNDDLSEEVSYEATEDQNCSRVTSLKSLSKAKISLKKTFLP